MEPVEVVYHADDEEDEAEEAFEEKSDGERRSEHSCEVVEAATE